MARPFKEKQDRKKQMSVFFTDEERFRLRQMAQTWGWTQSQMLSKLINQAYVSGSYLDGFEELSADEREDLNLRRQQVSFITSRRKAAAMERNQDRRNGLDRGLTNVMVVKAPEDLKLPGLFCKNLGMVWVIPYNIIYRVSIHSIIEYPCFASVLDYFTGQEIPKNQLSDFMLEQRDYILSSEGEKAVLRNLVEAYGRLSPSFLKFKTEEDRRVELNLPKSDVPYTNSQLDNREAAIKDLHQRMEAKRKAKIQKELARQKEEKIKKIVAKVKDLFAHYPNIKQLLPEDFDPNAQFEGAILDPLLGILISLDESLKETLDYEILLRSIKEAKLFVDKEAKPRGRPRIRPLPDPNAPKRKRGRPRKIVVEEQESQPKRKRGRPSKATLAARSLPFDDVAAENFNIASFVTLEQDPLSQNLSVEQKVDLLTNHQNKELKANSKVEVEPKGQTLFNFSDSDNTSKSKIEEEPLICPKGVNELFKGLNLPLKDNVILQEKVDQSQLQFTTYQGYAWLVLKLIKQEDQVVQINSFLDIICFNDLAYPLMAGSLALANDFTALGLKEQLINGSLSLSPIPTSEQLMDKKIQSLLHEPDIYKMLYFDQEVIQQVISQNFKEYNIAYSNTMAIDQAKVGYKAKFSYEEIH